MGSVGIGLHGRGVGCTVHILYTQLNMGSSNAEPGGRIGQVWDLPALEDQRLVVSRIWDRCSSIEHALQPIL